VFHIHLFFFLLFFVVAQVIEIFSVVARFIESYLDNPCILPIHVGFQTSKITILLLKSIKDYTSVHGFIIMAAALLKLTGGLKLLSNLFDF
jgi:hypothetical protein